MRSSKFLVVAGVAAGIFAFAQPAQAQMGLSRVEYIGLQQELRDRGCGNRHASGAVNAETRAAIGTCAQRLGVAANARAVLNALSLGFNPSGVAGRDDRPRAGGRPAGDRPVGADFGSFDTDVAPGSVRRQMEGVACGTPERIRGTPSARASGGRARTPPPCPANR